MTNGAQVVSRGKFTAKLSSAKDKIFIWSKASYKVAPESLSCLLSMRAKSLFQGARDAQEAKPGAADIKSLKERGLECMLQAIEAHLRSSKINDTDLYFMRSSIAVAQEELGQIDNSVASFMSAAVMAENFRWYADAEHMYVRAEKNARALAASMEKSEKQVFNKHYEGVASVYQDNGHKFESQKMLDYAEHCVRSAAKMRAALSNVTSPSVATEPKMDWSLANTGSAWHPTGD